MKEKTTRHRIVIIEDNDYIREGLRETLQSVDSYLIVNVYNNCEAALQNLQTDLPDVVLMDIELPNMDGIEGTKLIKKGLPNCIVLIITVHEDSEKVFQSLCAGATGYVIKNLRFEAIVKAIEEALAGGAPMSLSISRMVVESFRMYEDSPLTEREAEVLQYISEGKSYSTIAQEMFISKETVKSHTKNIYRKLEVVSKSEAIRKANKNKWLKPGM